MRLPRLFTPAPSGSLDVSAQNGPAHVLDTFVLERSGVSREVAVTVDPSGALDLVAVEDRRRLPEAVSRQLAFAGLAGPPRRLRAEELYLFEPQLAEQPGDAPGLNDPVFLYGVLRGPYSAAEAGPTRVKGQLAVCRGDVLAGFVRERAHAFRYPPAAGEKRPARTFHALLPGGHEGELVAGEAIVLTYPLLPPDAWDRHPGNEEVVALLLKDLLAALAGDRQRERGWLAKLAGAFVSSGDPLPERASLDEWLALADRALERFEAGSAERSEALFSRLRPPSETAPPVRATPQLPSRAEAADWMNDFLHAHRPPTGAAPRLTALTSSRWMEDFLPKREQSGERAAPAAKPEWMKDFEP